MATVVAVRGSASEIMDIVRDLRATGMTQGIDFDFAYRQAEWTDIFDPVPAHAKFTFYDERRGTFFALKYSDLAV
jgi:hypothetical protein